MTTRFRCFLTLGRALFAALSYSVLSLVANAVYGQFTTVINSPPSIIGDDQSIGSNTQLNVFDGGSVGINFSAGAFGVDNVEVNVFGGSVGHYFYALDGSQVTISGGSVGCCFEAWGGVVGEEFEDVDVDAEFLQDELPDWRSESDRGGLRERYDPRSIRYPAGRIAMIVSASGRS